MRKALVISLLTWVMLCCPGCVQYFLFHPSTQIVSTPAAIGLTFESVSFYTEDGLRLSGWWIPAEREEGVILFCHGNGGNISHNLDGAMVLYRLGMSVFIFDYRGFGLSEGEATEAGTYLDAEAAWAYLVQTRQIPTERIILFGRSLGGAVAARLARTRPARALIIESSFTSVQDIARDYVPWFPFFPSGRLYDTRQCLRDYPNEVLIIHSPDDEVVPFRHGLDLFQAAGNPKHFLEIRGSHNRGSLESLQTYEKGVGTFLATVFDRG